MARGLPLNNPCNIRISNADWQGKIHPSSDSEFEQFSEPEYGIRAACKIFINYQKMYDLRTVESLINRWAPSVENNTNAYILFVSNRIGISSAQEIDLTDILILVSFITAIIRYESGVQPYTDALILQAANDALN